MGDDVILSLSRIAGLWSLEWEDLTDPANSGSVSGFSVPWLDGEPNLYVGITNMYFNNAARQTAKIDYFRVEVGAPVPEPSSWALIALPALALRRRVACPRRSADVDMDADWHVW